MSDEVYIYISCGTFLELLDMMNNFIEKKKNTTYLLLGEGKRFKLLLCWIIN